MSSSVSPLTPTYSNRFIYCWVALMCNMQELAICQFILRINREQHITREAATCCSLLLTLASNLI